MNIEHLREQIPDYARDIKLNLGTILTEEGSPGLSQQQIDGIALASAYTTKYKPLITAISHEVHARLDKIMIQAAKAAASIMAMNNIYYRFLHLVNDKEYAELPAKLRMNVIGKPGIDKIDFELFCLAVSIINGCGMCIEAHTHEIVKAGLSKIAVQSSARIAAVINATAMTLALTESE